MNYKVIVSLPTSDDADETPLTLSELIIPEKDYSMNWKITNKDYNQFIEAVKDSVIRERLFLNLRTPDDAVEFLEYTDKYFDEGGLEYVSFDNSEDRKYLREQFSLNLKTKIKNSSEEYDSIVNGIGTDLYEYTYFEIDAYDRSLDGVHTSGVEMDRGDVYWVYTTRWGYPQIEASGEPLGKAHCLGEYNFLGEPLAIRSHYNIQRFIKRFSVNITPSGNSKIADNDGLIQTIAYDQALGYYNWKFPIHKIKSDDNWQDYVYPRED